MSGENTKQLMEALIFASAGPLAEATIKEVLGDQLDGRLIAEVVEELNADYRREERTFHIVKLAGGYQMVTRPEYGPWIKRLFKSKTRSKLSRAALETLSIIAYTQPVTKARIEALRGVNCDQVLHRLLERKLITLAGRAPKVGRPLLYRTTDEFLRYFGLNDLSDLPEPKELEEIFEGTPPGGGGQEILPN